MAGGANAQVECRKNCNNREEGGGRQEMSAKRCWKSGSVAPPFTTTIQANMDVKPKRRGTTDTDGEKMSEKQQKHPDVPNLRFVDHTRHTSGDVLNSQIKGNIHN